ncbi:branched-chain amino acid ABC transporter permease [Subtercola frigoramans]|uniref:Branched-chain amino acid transport system permease protein n=1 Tax=Subtercola frigoramans TaxID=120298 RepID=A0ABS2L982_9MICO|nr:branched-chain amino acid ABC transporter permease [Subtercola frigoramans]MBM7473663.1 branched-chain amino acid transport system permease protein [Subtercola frigoramans]
MTTTRADVPQVTVTRWTRTSRVGTPAVLVLFVIMFALPFMTALSNVRSVTDLLIFIILGSMWNIMAGYGGMESVGQQAYIGLGAYGLVVLADQLGINIFLAVPLAGIIAGIIAFLFSFLAFRLVGGYFAIGTWVIAEVVKLIITQFPSLGLGSGISLYAMSAFDRDLRIAVSYWIALGVTVLALLICVLLVRSGFGLGLTALRDDPIAAATSGVDVSRAKRLVFVISGVGTGMAGAIIAISTLRVQPDSLFSVQWSVLMIFMVVIGGVGTIEGPIIGALIFWGLREALADYGSLYLILLGIIAIVFALFFRGGVWGLIQKRRRFSVFPTGYSTWFGRLK